MTYEELANSEDEIWTDIFGYEGMYQISNFGNCKRLSYHKKCGKDYKSIRFIDEHHIRKAIMINGRVQFHLCKDGTTRVFLAHRLVMENFIGKSDLVVNHKDCNPLNNHISNLEYVTMSYNNAYAYQTGRRSAPWQGKTGRESPKNRGILQYSKSGDLIESFGSALDVRRKYGYSYQQIYECCHNRKETAYGYMWRFIK